MREKDFNKRLLLSITGDENKAWKEKLKELDGRGIKEAALFLTRFNQSQRKDIYRNLLSSKLESVPLCHIRNDMEVEELVFMEAKFKTKCFTIHENSFNFIQKWPGFEKKLYLEMDYNNAVSQKVMVEKIGGFCVDFSHFKAANVKWTKDFEYVYYRKGIANFFCNHLNGYDKKNNSDIHFIEKMDQFDYLKEIPEFLFGKIIALEVDNDIKKQIDFKKYLVDFLGKNFNK